VKGSPSSQTYRVFETINDIGTSKHEAKIEARENGATTWHEIGKEIGIHSYATMEAYRGVAKDCLRYAKAELDVRDLEKFTGLEVGAFLQEKIDDGVAYATLNKCCAALEKLEVALNCYAKENETGRAYDFSEAIKEAREAGRDLDRFDGTRAYRNPERLVNAVCGETFQLAAAIQQEGGARIREASHITQAQLKGLRADTQTGQIKGWIKVEGKGGKIREIGVKPGTYAKLGKAIENGQRFEFAKNAYRRELKAAAVATGQDYQGSHGLRWSWAQDRHAELQRNGKTYEQTIGQVSREMGHERADITEHYLR